jgi:hypothetical protein
MREITYTLLLAACANCVNFAKTSICQCNIRAGKEASKREKKMAGSIRWLVCFSVSNVREMPQKWSNSINRMKMYKSEKVSKNNNGTAANKKTNVFSRIRMNIVSIEMWTRQKVVW